VAVLAATGAGLCAGAQAAVVNISGGTSPFPGYGTTSGTHNVVNSGLSGVTDGTNGSASYKGSVTGNAAVVTTDLPLYNVDWYFVGSESGFVNKLIAPGINPAGLLVNSPTAGQFNENNQNNNCPGCLHGTNISPLFLGTSTAQTSSVLSFSFDDNHGNVIANGNANPNPGTAVASIVFSHVTQLTASTWQLSNDATSAWFLFAWNDGGNDADFDDLVGVARVYCATPNGAACGNTPPPVPLPAALPLFAGGLGVLGWFASRRKRKATA
jgi:hypothetical protein